MTGHHQDRGLGVAHRSGFAPEGGQRRFGFGYPPQLHQGHEPPELALAFTPVITGRPGQFDDLRPGGQPVLCAVGVP